jgi:hypothetical protein
MSFHEFYPEEAVIFDWNNLTVTENIECGAANLQLEYYQKYLVLNNFLT